MMCDECGIRPANIHLTTIVGSERQEKNLCSACVAKYQKTFPKLDLGNLAGILGGLLDPAKRIDSEEDAKIELTCRKCGMTYREFKKGDQLGCPECYAAFRQPLEKALGRMHGNTQHAGKVPDGVSGSIALKLSIEKARKELAVAIGAERYEQAAELRDKIRMLTAKLNSLSDAEEEKSNE